MLQAGDCSVLPPVGPHRLTPSILPLHSAISLICQPLFRVWPREINIGFPDDNSIAHMIVLPAFGPDDLVVYVPHQKNNPHIRPPALIRRTILRPPL